MSLSVRFCRGYFCFSCLLLLTTLLPAFCALFLARFLYKLYLGAVKAGRKKRYLGISIYIYLDHHCPRRGHFGYFDRNTDSLTFLYNNVFPMNIAMMMMMAMTMFVHQCLPMIIPCACQPVRVMPQHDDDGRDNDVDSEKSKLFDKFNINHIVNLPGMFPGRLSFRKPLLLFFPFSRCCCCSPLLLFVVFRLLLLLLLLLMLFFPLSLKMIMLITVF